MDLKKLSVGQKLSDNDPRTGGRVIRVEEILPNGILGRDGAGRLRRYLARRIFDDGKPRKSGLSVIAEAPPGQAKA